jgi:cytochrome P450
MSQTDTRQPPIDASQPGWMVELMLDPEFARDPRPAFERLRDGPPKRDELELPGGTPTIVVSRATDVDQVLRNPKVFSSQFGSGMGGLGNDRPISPPARWPSWSRTSPSSSTS